MNLYVADKNNCTDGVAHTLLQRLNVDMPIVLVSRAENFVFNEELLKLDKYCLICFTEYSWLWTRDKTHIWGENTEEFLQWLPNGEWMKFDEFVRNNPPILTLKRELLKDAVSDILKPIEYPAWCEIPPTQSREDFNARPVNTFFYWGRSHESRVRLHAEIWQQSSVKGYAVCDSILFFNTFLQQESNPNKIVSFHIPHYGRMDISYLLAVNVLSKTSISMAGGGFKCFRTMECPVNSVMSMERNNFAWSFDWNDENCILFEEGKELQMIEEALKDENLYDKYCNGVETCRKYQVNNYVPFLEKLIQDAL